MFRSAVAAYLWDFPVRNFEDVLDRMTGEWGVGELALWSCAPHTVRLRCVDGAACLETAEGGCAFAAREPLYRNTRLRPLPARMPAPFPSLEALLDACARHAIDVRLLICATATGRLAETFEAAAVKRPGGAASGCSLCLMDADVRAFLEAVVADLSSRDGVAALELRDFVTRDAAFWSGHAPWRQALGDDVCALLSMCLCESCRREAVRYDIDIDALEHHAQAAASGDLRPAAEASTSSAGSAVHALMELRARALADLAAALARASACPLMLHQSGDADERRQHAALDPRLFAALSRDLPAEHDARSPAGTTPIRLDLQLLPWRSPQRDPAGIVKACRQAADLGYAGVTFHTLGEMTPPIATAIRQAARFTRRQQPPP